MQACIPGGLLCNVCVTFPWFTQVGITVIHERVGTFHSFPVSLLNKYGMFWHQTHESIYYSISLCGPYDIICTIAACFTASKMCCFDACLRATILLDPGTFLIISWHAYVCYDNTQMSHFGWTCVVFHTWTVHLLETLEMGACCRHNNRRLSDAFWCLSSPHPTLTPHPQAKGDS